jgi:hypothetical protein
MVQRYSACVKKEEGKGMKQTDHSNYADIARPSLAESYRRKGPDRPGPADQTPSKLLVMYRLYWVYKTHGRSHDPRKQEIEIDASDGCLDDRNVCVWYSLIRA